jgi:hypothetical protein
MNKSTISITVPTSLLMAVGTNRSKFFTLAALERLGWRRYIQLRGLVTGTWDTDDAVLNPLSNFKPSQRFRAIDQPHVEATIFWAPTPDDVRYIESTKYFTRGTARSGSKIEWPL